VRPDGTVKILDFGLAKLAGPAESEALARLPAEDSPTLTSPTSLTLGGIILGTAGQQGGAGTLEPRDLGAGRGVQGGRFSPDGRWIVYSGLAAGDGIYVQPFPGPGRRRQVAPAGHFPVCPQDGKEIVYVDREEGAVWSIAGRGRATPSGSLSRCVCSGACGVHLGQCSRRNRSACPPPGRGSSLRRGWSSPTAT
jgi:hypothetical protein